MQIGSQRCEGQNAGDPDEEEARPAEPETEAHTEPETEAQTEPEPAAVEEPEPVAELPEPEPVAAEVEPIEWDAERYTTDIEEPDWFAAEVIEADQERAVIDEPEPEPEPPVDQVESVDANHPAEAISATETVNPVEYVGPTSVPDEVAGADEMEVAPTGTQHEGTTTGTAPPPHTARAFPGADDLDAAIAALRAAGRSSEALPPADRLHRSEPAEAETEPEWPPRSTFTRPPTTTGAATRGPASRAYRRLRRIFPG